MKKKLLSAAILAYLSGNGLICAANQYSQRTYDNALLLKAGGLVAASADGSLVLDIGNGVMDCDLVVDVTALEKDTGDESYTVVLEGSPDAAFGTAANIVVMARIVLGAAAATAMAPTGSAGASNTGRYLVPVRNEIGGTTYRYARIRTVVAGTVVTGINYTAFLAKDD